MNLMNKLVVLSLVALCLFAFAALPNRTLEPAAHGLMKVHATVLVTSVTLLLTVEAASVARSLRSQRRLAADRSLASNHPRSLYVYRVATLPDVDGDHFWRARLLADALGHYKNLNVLLFPVRRKACDGALQQVWTSH